MDRQMIPYGRQLIDEEDINAVIEVLRSDYLTQGPTIGYFEQGLQDYCQAPFARVLNSATSALVATYAAIGVGPGSVVWTSPISFVATSNAALLLGADVDFVDVDPFSGNMDMQALQQKLIGSNRIPDIVVAVHLSGQSCDMQTLSSLADQFGFKVVEDASHALGGQYQGYPIGCCRFSDAAIFSFHPIKSIAAGEGGAVLSHNPEYIKQIELYRQHGIQPAGDAEKPWLYEQVSLGQNYRMSDIHAALGASQLSKLDSFVARRRLLSLNYLESLADLPVTMSTTEGINQSACHLFIIRLQDEQVRHRDSIFNYMRDHGIGVQIHYIPIHTQPYYQSLGFRSESLPQSIKFYEQIISLPLYPALTDEQQQKVVVTLKEALDVVL